MSGGVGIIAVGSFGSTTLPPGCQSLSAIWLIDDLLNSDKSDGLLISYLARWSTVACGRAIWFAFSKNAIFWVFVNTMT